ARRRGPAGGGSVLIRQYAALRWGLLPGRIKLGSKIEDCLTNAQRCETLANEARDTLVRDALRHAAQQWRSRADLLGQHGDAGSEPQQERPPVGWGRF